MLSQVIVEDSQEDVYTRYTGYTQATQNTQKKSESRLAQTANVKGRLMPRNDKNSLIELTSDQCVSHNQLRDSLNQGPRISFVVSGHNHDRAQIGTVIPENSSMNSSPKSQATGTRSHEQTFHAFLAPKIREAEAREQNFSPQLPLAMGSRMRDKIGGQMMSDICRDSLEALPQRAFLSSS